jgi:hypothetical protein
MTERIIRRSPPYGTPERSNSMQALTSHIKGLHFLLSIGTHTPANLVSMMREDVLTSMNASRVHVASEEGSRRVMPGSRSKS